MQNDNPLYDHLTVFCKRCGKDTGITARGLMNRATFDCPHCAHRIKTVYTKTAEVKKNIDLHSPLNEELDAALNDVLDEVLCSRCKKELRITVSNCPFHILATVLSSTGAGNMLCTGVECAIWDRQHNCCGFIQK